MENGIVTNIRRDGGAIQIDDEWYSSYEGIEIRKAKVNRGDTVSFGWVAKGPFHNIKTAIDINDKGASGESLTPTGTAAGPSKKFGAVRLERDRCIIRQNSLTNAVNYGITKDHAADGIENILATAKRFEAYSSGDADFEKMEKVAHDMLSGTDEE